MTKRNANKEWQLTQPAVRLYVRTNENAGQTTWLTPNYEVKQVFTSEEEEEDLQYIKYWAELFNGLTAKDCRCNTYQVTTKYLNLGQKLIKRHPQVSLRKLDAGSLAKTAAFNKLYNELFSRILKSATKSHLTFADGTRPYN